LAAITARMRAAPTVPPAVKTQFETFAKDYDSVRVKFGVAAPGGAGGPGGGRGAGGGGGRGGGDPANVLGRVATAKANLLAMWEVPSSGTMRQVNDAKSALPKAIAEANALFARATSLSAALKPFEMTLTAPPTVP